MKDQAKWQELLVDAVNAPSKIMTDYTRAIPKQEEVLLLRFIEEEAFSIMFQVVLMIR